MKKILAIDDQKDNLTTIEAVLKGHMADCEVLTALSGKEGIEIAIKEQPDTILLDIIMPKMDGYEVCKKLKEDESTKHIPVVMITAIRTDIESRVKGLNIGADAFLSKPINPVELTAQVKVMLRIKEAEDKLRTEKELLDKKVKERTKNLRVSEERLRNIFENSTNLFYSHTSDHILTYLSPQIMDILGYTQEEALIKWTELTSENPINKIGFKHTVNAIETGKPQPPYELELVHKSGKKVWVEIREAPVVKNGKTVSIVGALTDITERKQLEEKEKEHIRNIELLSKTAMQFVDFPQDKDIYTFIGEKLKEFTGENSIIVVNSIDAEKDILTNRTVLGLGKLSEKVAGLLGKHPVGMTFDAKDQILSVLSDGKLHLYGEGLYGVFLKSVPETICNSIEKLLNIKTIYGIGFAKDNELFGTAVIFLREGTGEPKNKQIIETFIKQASIAVQKRQAEEALIESNENFQQVVSNITTVVWKADIGENGAFDNTYSSPVLDELLELPAGTMKNDWDKYFSKIKPEYLERVNNAFREAIKSPGKQIDCEYEVLKDNGQTIWVNSKGRCFEKNGKLHVFGSTTDITERKKIESKLKQNENMLRQIIDTSPNCIFVKDRNGMYLVANKRMAELHSTTPEELVGKYDYKIAQQWFETVDYNEFRKAEQDVIDNKKTLFIIEESFVYNDGTARWFQTTKIPFELEDNQKCLLVISIDITERKQAEETLKQSEKDYRNLFNNATDAIYIQDKEGRFLDVNQGAVDMYGYPREFFIGKTPGFLSAPGKNDMNKIVGFIEDAFNGKPRQYDFWGIRKNGEVFPKIVRSQKAPFQGQDVILTFAIDITERKQAEERVSELLAETTINKNLLEIVINSTPDWIFAKDKDFRYILVSKSYASAMGKSPEDFIGKDDIEIGFPKELIFGNPDKKIVGFRNDDKTVLSGEIIHNSYDPVLLDKTLHIFDTYKMPLKDKDGNIYAVLGFARDITERKKADEELRKKMIELEIFNDATVDREIMINELRKEINELHRKSGNEPKYDIVE